MHRDDRTVCGLQFVAGGDEFQLRVQVLEHGLGRVEGGRVDEVLNVARNGGALTDFAERRNRAAQFPRQVGQR